MLGSPNAKAPAQEAERDPRGTDAHTSGAKLDHGKPRVGLVLSEFSRALLEVAKVGTFGAIKYTPRGWVDVPDGIERYEDAQLRHWLKEHAQGPIDPDMNLLHVAAQAWNVLARLELILRAQEQARNTIVLQ